MPETASGMIHGQHASAKPGLEDAEEGVKKQKRISDSFRHACHVMDNVQGVKSATEISWRTKLRQRSMTGAK